MGTSARLSGLVVALALLAPPVATSAVVVHVLADHDSDAAEHAADLDVFRHGHRHDRVVTTHDHESAPPEAAFALEGPFRIAATLETPCILPCPGVTTRAFASLPWDTGPPGPETSSVVLRI